MALFRGTLFSSRWLTILNIIPASEPPNTERGQDMAHSENDKKSANGSTGSKQNAKPGKSAGKRKSTSELPAWLIPFVSLVSVGAAVGAGLYATRDKWLPKDEEYGDDFAAAFATNETDSENFDQTRHAGLDSMRDHPGEDWSDVDDMSDASFPASDPPSFTPGTAS